MKLPTAFVVLAAALLAGCIEVEQYPRYRNGAYDGKPDMLPAQAQFHGDRLAWNAAIIDRNHEQNEYRRDPPPDNHPREAER